MVAAQAAENHRDEWGLTWYLRWGIYKSNNFNLNLITKFMSNSRTSGFKDILPGSISQMIMKSVPISMRIAKLYNEMRHLVLSLLQSQWKLRQQIRVSQWRESHCRTNTIVKTKKEIQERRTVTFKVRDPSRKVNHLSKVIWNYNRVQQICQFHQNRLANPITVSLMHI